MLIEKKIQTHKTQMSKKGGKFNFFLVKNTNDSKMLIPFDQIGKVSFSNTMNIHLCAFARVCL